MTHRAGADMPAAEDFSLLPAPLVGDGRLDEEGFPSAPRRERPWRLVTRRSAGEGFFGAVLGALTTDDGTPTPLQLGLVAAIASAFGTLRGFVDAPPDAAVDPVTAEDLLALPRLEPSEAAAALHDPDQRLRCVHLMVTCEMLLHPLPSSLDARVEAYAAALDVHPDALKVSRDLAEQHLSLAYADIQRSSYYRKETLREAAEGKLVELARNKLAYYGVGREEKVARQWESLADLPDGSWGREVARFYEVHGFPFPGEPHGIYEIGAHHDFVHVLADYAPTPEGEIDVFGFIAGVMDDPRGFMQFVFTLALFQNASVDKVGGLKVAIARADTLADAGATRRLADAIVRAAECPVDVMAGIDHFEWAPFPLEVVRARLGVAPKRVEGPGYLFVPDPA